jgi:hypothetical protein
MWIALLWACGTPEAMPPLPVDEAPSAPAPAAAPAQADEAPAPSLEPARLGVVEEVLPTAAYTFARMDACGMVAWVAGPPTELEVGQVVSMPEGMVMTNFESPTLERTFEAILFVDWMKVTDQQPECSPPVKATDNQYVGVVKQTMASAGYTYAELDVCGDTVWVAGPEMPLQPGQTLLSPKGSEMTNFESPSLGRSFDSIAFVPKMKVVPGVPYCGDE